MATGARLGVADTTVGRALAAVGQAQDEAAPQLDLDRIRVCCFDRRQHLDPNRTCDDYHSHALMLERAALERQLGALVCATLTAPIRFARA